LREAAQDSITYLSPTATRRSSVPMRTITAVLAVVLAGDEVVKKFSGKMARENI
jgi:hypothetical protein